MLESNQKSDLRAVLVKYAANILSRRPYFSHQFKNKLYFRSQKISDEDCSDVVEKIVEDLRASGYLDDTYLTQAFVRRQLGKGYGPKIISYKLKVLGVSFGAIKEALKSEATEEALSQAKIKAVGRVNPLEKQKIQFKLYQRGF